MSKYRIDEQNTSMLHVMFKIINENVPNLCIFICFCGLFQIMLFLGKAVTSSQWLFSSNIAYFKKDVRAKNEFFTLFSGDRKLYQ